MRVSTYQMYEKIVTGSNNRFKHDGSEEWETYFDFSYVHGTVCLIRIIIHLDFAISWVGNGGSQVSTIFVGML